VTFFPEHPAFVPPEKDEYKVWRYMDFTKFVSMLARRSLYFASLKKCLKKTHSRACFLTRISSAGHGKLSRIYPSMSGGDSLYILAPGKRH